MKKYAFILWAALTMTGVFTACTDNDSPMIEQVETKTATIHATIDGDLGSRVALTDDAENRVVKVDWKQDDAFKINVNGTDFTFKYTADNKFECDATDFPATFESAGTVTATYPAVAPIAYTSQEGTLAGAESFLTMTATLDVEAGQSTEDLALNFKHQSSIVKLTLKNDDFKEKSVTWVTLNNGGNVVATATQAFTGAADGSIQAYFVVEPQAMVDTWILAVCEGSNYTATLSGKTLEAGKLYNVEKEMGKLTTLIGNKTAEQAVKGDYAMADGSFVSKDATLTDIQQANVRGIVFWTTAETTMEGRTTPAKLTDDAIMAIDFPNCTHGLIVSLKNVSAQTMYWQPYGTDIASWQTSDFADINKDKYKSIASGFGATDPINYILGYQNTKLLKAYNAQCADANKVLPVSSLDEFSANNPAPLHTTGWFIPSVKELHMLCYKDVDDVKNEGSRGVDTKTVINASLSAVDGVALTTANYWPSTEVSNYSYMAFVVQFTNAYVTTGGKSAVPFGFSRAVCAF